ncbi:MAG: hypothetical protein U5O16_21405 [Rhodococcus sp. (in: high G+C Gram-positive bacteria)]|uniref:hypothetical protein n=1 Tax=Rhodococcus sp. TaxID=1831 RepID=UPI002AD866A7|nr:hypothetical protein [Rhodococcus sp. (in: high G+C Gram-positive bacteria)]
MRPRRQSNVVAAGWCDDWFDEWRVVDAAMSWFHGASIIAEGFGIELGAITVSSASAAAVAEVTGENARGGGAPWSGGRRCGFVHG